MTPTLQWLAPCGAGKGHMGDSEGHDKQFLDVEPGTNLSALQNSI